MHDSLFITEFPNTLLYSEDEIFIEEGNKLGLGSAVTNSFVTVLEIILHRAHLKNKSLKSFPIILLQNWQYEVFCWHSKH